MKRVPSSYLWLLDPSSSSHNTNFTSHSKTSHVISDPMYTKSKLMNEFIAAGLPSSRLLFAPRVKKIRHVSRHAAADLFLDTFVYGAHSTATDALKGVNI